MAGTLKFLWDHIGRTVGLTASAEDDAYPGWNLETGNLQRFWRGLDTAEVSLTWDAGTGAALTVDTVVLSDASLLVAAQSFVALQWSNDGSSFTDVWTLTPMQTGDLAFPDQRHYVQSSASLTKRAWRIRIYGPIQSVPSLSGSIFVGPATVCPTNPTYARAWGADRTYRGGDIELNWPPMSAPAAQAFMAALARMTPDVAEAFHETVAGVAYGGSLPVWLYDTAGEVFGGGTGVPQLFPVLCAAPMAARISAVTPAVETGPTGTRWRVRR